MWTEGSPVPAVCPECLGRGRVAVAELCHGCMGIRHHTPLLDTLAQAAPREPAVNCPLCEGSGWHRAACPRCGGTGVGVR